MADLYQYLQDNPTDEMARDVLTKVLYNYLIKITFP